MEASVFRKNIEGAWVGHAEQTCCHPWSTSVQDKADEFALLYNNQRQTRTKWNQYSEVSLSTGAFHPSRKQGTKQLYKDSKQQFLKPIFSCVFIMPLFTVFYPQFTILQTTADALKSSKDEKKLGLQGMGEWGASTNRITSVPDKRQNTILTMRGGALGEEV